MAQTPSNERIIEAAKEVGYFSTSDDYIYAPDNKGVYICRGWDIFCDRVRSSKRLSKAKVYRLDTYREVLELASETDHTGDETDSQLFTGYTVKGYVTLFDYESGRKPLLTLRLDTYSLGDLWPTLGCGFYVIKDEARGKLIDVFEKWDIQVFTGEKDGPQLHKLCPECKRNYLQFNDDDMCSYCTEKHQLNPHTV